MPRSPAPVRNLMGSAASFRREVFELVGGFRSELGRSDNERPLGCEETELCIRLRQHAPDSILLSDNRAVAWHSVPKIAAGSPTSGPGASPKGSPKRR